MLFDSSTGWDLKVTNYIFKDEDVSPPSLGLYNSGRYLHMERVCGFHLSFGGIPDKFNLFHAFIAL